MSVFTALKNTAFSTQKPRFFTIFPCCKISSIFFHKKLVHIVDNL
jgi:hypothetical protein